MTNRKDDETTERGVVGPEGQRRPVSDVGNAMKVGRLSVGIEEEEVEKPPRKVLLENWRKKE